MLLGAELKISEFSGENIDLLAASFDRTEHCVHQFDNPALTPSANSPRFS
jgi:hypothetical protein